MLHEKFDVQSGATVKQYRYRTAMVRDRVISMPRTQMGGLEAKLAEAAGAPVDNHTAYEVTSRDGQVIYISTSDLTMAIGLSLEVGEW